jgi:gas vesicle protein
MTRDSENSGQGLSMALGFMIGVTAGLAAGVLLAPKSGKETREQIAQKTREGYDRAQSVTKQTVGQAKDKASSVANKTRAAVREGKRAAREA